MTCFHPLTGVRGNDGIVRFTPKGRINIHSEVTVACGRCRGCRLERSRQWAIRIMHEAQTHETNSFLTLTYSDEHLPHHGSLVLEDWQKFCKNTRKKMGRFRYYHCGEYGDLFHRPHYHATLFGLNFRADRHQVGTNHQGDPLYESPTLDKLWGKGYAQIGALTFESAAYVARYIMKKQTGDEEVPTYGDLKPPYATMSRRPGIGKTWFDKYNKDVSTGDFVVINGRKAQPPKYYDYRLEILNPEEFKKIKTARKEQQNNEKNQKEQTWQRLEIREKYATKQTNQLKRPLHAPNTNTNT